MIDTIIFDFGDVFINLEKERCKKAFHNLGLPHLNADLLTQNDRYEKGIIDENTFLTSFQKYIPNANLIEIKSAWNAIIGDFPEERLEFLQLLSQNYRLFLLTNTDKTHIQHFEESVGVSFYSAFYQCFDKVFYSYELRLRKPDPAVFIKIINNYNLSPKKTLFVDDKKENTDAAKLLGLNIWTLQVGQEEVTDLLSNAIFNK